VIFESAPAFLLLLLVPLVFWWRNRNRRAGGTIRFSWTRTAADAGRSLRQRWSFIPTLLRTLAVVLLIVAIARPQMGMEQARVVNEGIAIEMAVDRSSSMGAEMVYEGQRMNRLEVVKRVFEAFVLGDGKSLAGRSNDLVGMVVFARYPETWCPLTLGHGALPRFLETVHLARPQTREDGTAIGDAIALAAARLKTAEEVMKQQAPERAAKFDIRSKIMILLTDGNQTAGERHPVEAAKLAREWGIKIYTIAIGGDETVRGQDTIFGRFFQLGGDATVDTSTLQAVAKETGGRFFEARDAKALAAIYRDIDQLERSEIESIRYVDYKELFLPFALVAFFLLGAEIALNCTVFRKIP
jgi:Ca-activated chloride channel family protein